MVHSATGRQHGGGALLVLAVGRGAPSHTRRHGQRHCQPQPGSRNAALSHVPALPAATVDRRPSTIQPTHQPHPDSTARCTLHHPHRTAPAHSSICTTRTAPSAPPAQLHLHHPHLDSTAYHPHHPHLDSTAHHPYHPTTRPPAHVHPPCRGRASKKASTAPRRRCS